MSHLYISYFPLKIIMYGDKGVELVKEAVRAGESLAPFNEDSVRYALGGPVNQFSGFLSMCELLFL